MFFVPCRSITTKSICVIIKVYGKQTSPTSFKLHVYIYFLIPVKSTLMLNKLLIKNIIQTAIYCSWNAKNACAWLYLTDKISIICLELATTFWEASLLKSWYLSAVVIYLICLSFRVQTSIRLFSIEFPRESQCIAKQIILFLTNKFSVSEPLRIKLFFLEMWPNTTAQNLSMRPKSSRASCLSTEMNGPLA